MPLYSGIKELSITLDKDAIVKPYNKYRNIKPILYYGSSITQGGCASRSDNCYQALISEWTNTDYYILGFSGNAKGEAQMASFLSNIDTSIFVLDYDHNADSPQELRNTHLNLYKTFRNNPKNKNTPIILLSKPDGLRDINGEERFQIIKATYDYALKYGDNNIYLIDGRTIYKKELIDHSTIDGVHPNDIGFYFFALKLYEIIKKII